MPGPIPDELARILAETPELQNAFLVGGCVRDALLGIPNKDFDIEVFGVSYEQLAHALSRWGRIDLVGRSFGVAKLTTGSGCSYDFTIPRRDSKVAPGHKGFAIHFDLNIPPQQAASRRDFTLNAIMFDPRAQRTLDFFGGVRDLNEKILRHTSDAFVEDPLRVLRGMQLAARFALQPAPETVELCRRIKSGFHELAEDRVRDEWFKWAEKSAVPSLGLKFLAATEWVDHFPEIKAMIGTPQDPEWHPEGDVFIHTCHCCDALATLPEWQSADSQSRIVYMLAVLAHDFGKSQTTRGEMKGGRMRIVSPGHEEASGALAESFLNRMQAPGCIRQRVIPLVVNHMAHFQTVTDRSVRRLSRRLEPENIRGLCVVMTADRMGRPPRPPGEPAGLRHLLDKAAELHVRESAPPPILLGRHLIELGLRPGPVFGELLSKAYDAQLEGTFFSLTEALDWLKRQEEFQRSEADGAGRG